MKKTISLKWIITSVLAIIVTIVLTVGAKVSINADTKKDALINREGPALKIGRYYIDGDTEQYYLEVTKEGTIRLCDIDYMEYATLGNEDIDSYPEEQQKLMKESIKKYAEKKSKAYKYKVVETISEDSTYHNIFIFTEWNEKPSSVSEDFTLYTGLGYSYIDENTIKSSDQIFIYYDEELGDTVYKTETPTRVVDSISYKEKMNNAKDDYSGYKKISSDVCGYEINVCFPEKWNEYLVTTDTQFMGMQLFNGEVPEQLEIIDGNIYIAVATHGFADRYVYDAGYDKCEKENFTTKNGYGLIIYYDKNGMPTFATFDDYKDICIFFDVESKEEITEIMNIVNSIEIK